MSGGYNQHQQRPWQDKNELLRSYRGWLYRVAIELGGLREGGQLVQELAQEGYIAMWRSLDNFDPALGSLPHWLTKNARARMLEVLRRDARFGKPEARGVHTRPQSIGASEGSLDELRDAGWDHKADDEVEDLVLQAYMRGSVHRALSVLTPDQRRYVELRFWKGWSETQMYQRRAFDPEVNVRGLWTGKSGAAARLRDELRGIA